MRLLEAPVGQTALNVAVHVGTWILATTRNPDRVTQLNGLGAGEVFLERPDLSRQIPDRYLTGITTPRDPV